MRFDKLAKVIQLGETPDGYGGSTFTRTEVGSIGCIITPHIETAINQPYGTTHLDKWKVITLDKIVVENFLIESEGVIYKVLEDRQHKLNRRVLICEVDIDANS